MRRALAAALGVAILAGSALVAQASSLTIDAGVLETITMPAEIEVPDDPVEYITVQVVLRRYSGQIKNFRSIDESVNYLVPTDKAYTVGFTGSVYDCAGDNEVDTAQPHGVGTFGPFADSPIIHTLCVQQNQDGLTVTVEDSTGGS